MDLATIGVIVVCFITSTLSQCPTGSDMVTQPDDSPLTCSSNTPCPNPYFCASGVCCINCPANQEWNNCGSACNRTCEVPNPICIDLCVPGCHCPASAPIWHNDQCIRQEKCGKCDKPVEIGPCDGIFPRWYHFNGQCLPFYYGGCGGYDNNFQSEADCIRACQSGDIKKCPSDSPVVNTATGNELNCGIGGENCPDRTFCNADPFGRFAVCCPVCSQAVEPGTCRGSFPRWYFNSVTNRCENFIYGGCGGNANRFVTEHECQRRCPPLPDKCPAGHPLLGPTGAELTCRTQPCPKGSFCKTHPADAYTVCCPTCILEKDPGPCEAAITMWYFNSQLQTCETFVYGGCEGNHNRFSTLTECQDTCGYKACPSLRACQLQTCRPCASHQIYAVDTNGCPTCSCVDPLPCKGATCERCKTCQMMQIICVTTPCEPQPVCLPDRCPLMRCALYCEAYAKDVYGCPICKCIDPCQDVKCATHEECIIMQGYAVCMDRDVPIKCPSGPPLPGLFCGRGPGRQKCPPGTYCSIAPDDSFAVCCPDTCPAGAPVLDASGSKIYCNNLRCPKGSFCHPDPSHPNSVCCPACSLEKDIGPCKGAFPRWYFDSEAQMCKPFTYGGCLGNANNFVTEEECRDACHRCPTRPVNGTTCTLPKCLPPASHEVYVFDINGCPTCDLVDPLPCKNIKCPRCQSCRMVQVQCVRAPCPPKAMCIDDPCPEKQPCSNKCDAYDKDQFGCRRCSCNDVCEDVRCMTEKEQCMVMDGFAVCKQRATASSNIVLPSDLTTCVLLFLWYLTA